MINTSRTIFFQRSYNSNKMAPISTTITEVQQIQDIPAKIIAFQNGSSKTIHTTGPAQKGRSLFHLEIGNGMPLKWFNIIMIFGIHLWALHSVFVVKFSVPIVIWGVIMGIISGFGVTGGVHRLWTHRTYKANVPLRVILMICFSAAGQNTIFDWVRDHRVHHKFSDSDADPHNASQGFFFSHCGWLMQEKHPDVIRKGNQLDMNDVLSDPVVQFSQKHFIPLKLLFCFIIPTMIPVYFFGEEWYNTFLSQCLIRYTITLNSTWAVNSAAHIWGWKPYDKSIKPTQNPIVSLFALGEGWHNYHHVFPWDYKAAELGTYSLNFTTMFLDGFSRIGWAWDLKEPSKDLVYRVMVKNAAKHAHDHSHPPEVPEPSADVM